MGGAVSSGQNNRELVDNLCYEDYIQSPEVEKVFRQIDRADFMVFADDQEDTLEAYENHAWRRGTLHQSAPCIYTKAVEALKFAKGVSFLNIGSGTGYLSTMVGLLIGPYGINHGIEIYPENIEFANKKQVEFKERNPCYDPVTYCEPFFVAGNGLLVSPANLLYDRIYCGAACPSEHAQLMKNMLAIHGRLVMPHESQLECIVRVSESEWSTEVVLPNVSFAPLILPSQESVKDLETLQIDLEPLPLKQHCRLQILDHLGRSRYGEISQLPLPQHLKDYVSYFKDWGPPSEDLKILCPIDHTKGKPSDMVLNEEQDEGAAEGEDPPSSRRYQRELENFLGGHPSAGQFNIICNFNGVYLQIPGNRRDDEDRSNESEDGMDTDEELLKEDKSEELNGEFAESVDISDESYGSADTSDGGLAECSDPSLAMMADSAIGDVTEDSAIADQEGHTSEERHSNEV